MDKLIINRIEQRTNDLNRLLEHQEALRKEIKETELRSQRAHAQILELKGLLEELKAEQSKKAEKKPKKVKSLKETTSKAGSTS
jgi:hypothetical protein